MKAVICLFRRSKQLFNNTKIMNSFCTVGADELFVDPRLAEHYTTFRPSPPHNVINEIVSFTKQKLTPPFNQAVDVGCGSGQSTSLLSPYFNNVLGIDVSEAQLDQARKKEKYSNVSYKSGSCELIPLADKSAELISASQAAHWFNLPLFYNEVDRVLVPGGVVAVYCYAFPRPEGQKFSDEILEHMRRIYNVETAGYWHENRKTVDDNYASLELPYSEQVRHTIYIDSENHWSVAHYVGYIQTWSAYQTFLEAKPEKAKEILVKFQKDLSTAVGENVPLNEPAIAIRWKYSLLMARKPL